MKYSRYALTPIFIMISTLAFSHLGQASVEEQPASATPAAPGQETTAEKKASLEKLQMEMQNPLSYLWMLNNQFTYFELGGELTDGRSPHIWNWDIQPSMPYKLTGDWLLINRPVLPLLGNFPYYDEDNEELETTSGMGDMQYLGLVGKSVPQGKPILAYGLTFQFPTASDESLGTGKWCVGPAFVFAVVGKPFEWTYGVVIQQWWSFAGPQGRDDVNKTQIAPIYYYNLPNGWQIGGEPYWNANWEKGSFGGENVWNIPLQIMVGKIVKLGRLPIRINFGWEYSVRREKDLGVTQAWQLEVTPVIPSLW